MENEKAVVVVKWATVGVWFLAGMVVGSIVTKRKQPKIVWRA